MRLQLRITGDLQGKREVLLEGPGEFLIGRVEESAVPLHDTLASKRHAVFLVDDDRRVRLRDLGSTNGTRVDGRMLGGKEKSKDTRTPEPGRDPLEADVHEGTVVEIGSTRIAVSLGDAAAEERERIAAMLEQAEGKLAEAMAIVQRVLALDPNNTRANVLVHASEGLAEHIQSRR